LINSTEQLKQTVNDMEIQLERNMKNFVKSVN